MSGFLDKFNTATRIGSSTVYGLEPIDADECECIEKHSPAQLFGHLYFCGVFCHVHFLRVHYQDQVQSPVCDPNNRWEDVCGLDQIAFSTIEIPGYEGEWVLWLYPGSR